MGIYTWNHISRIHCIFILDEAETIHQLDLHYLASTVGTKVRLDILLGSCEVDYIQYRYGIGRRKQ